MREDHYDLIGNVSVKEALLQSATQSATIVTPKDVINEPAHYSRDGFQVWDIIEHFNLNYNMGNVAKYILRAGVKTPDPLEDYKKARAYINREIAIREGQTAFHRAIAGN